MTTLTGGPSLTAQYRGVLRSEWIKLISVRSTYLSMLVAIGLALLIGVLDTSSAASNWATMTAADRAAFDPVGTSFDGLQFGVLAFGVLGVLAISSEYGTGMIRTSLTAVPRRGMLYATKAAVLGALTLALGEAFSFVTFFLGQAMLSSKHLQVSLGDPGVFRAVFAAGLFLFVVTMVGFGLGALIRHSAGALAALFGLLFIAYAFARAIEKWSYLPDRLLLTNASDVLGQVHVHADHPLRIPSLGFAYFDLALYLVVFVGAGAARAMRDA